MAASQAAPRPHPLRPRPLRHRSSPLLERAAGRSEERPLALPWGRARCRARAFPPAAGQAALPAHRAGAAVPPAPPHSVRGWEPRRPPPAPLRPRARRPRRPAHPRSSRWTVVHLTASGCSGRTLRAARRPTPAAAAPLRPATTDLRPHQRRTRPPHPQSPPTALPPQRHLLSRGSRARRP